jgi:hypothetical protein
LQFLHELPDFVVENPDCSLGADQNFIYYTNFTRSPDYLTHVAHEGGMKDIEPYKPWIRLQWRLHLYLQRYSNTAGGNIRKGGIGGNNQEYYCRDKLITCNIIFRRLTSFWGIYHIIDMVLECDILWMFVFFIFTQPLKALGSIFILCCIMLIVRLYGFRFGRIKRLLSRYIR